MNNSPASAGTISKVIALERKDVCMDQARIRNFCIIAHIDHGKSTLADRLLEYTGAVSARKMVAQVLDSMDLERERGITIKARAVRLTYRAEDGRDYLLNLIDTPGHVDFSYEVSRSLAACEGALLLVDASQGIQAQTIANLYLALEHDLEIIPVINKIDLPGADPERVLKELADVGGFTREEVLTASAKTGLGTKEILEAIVRRIPPPRGSLESPAQALVFDSHFDSYRGVIAYLRMVKRRLRTGEKIKTMATGKEFRSEEHTSELQSRPHLVCRLLLEKKKLTTDTECERAECICACDRYLAAAEVHVTDDCPLPVPSDAPLPHYQCPWPGGIFRSWHYR